MFVKERMTPNPVTGTPDMSVTEAQEIMKKGKFRHLPIMNEAGEMIGLLTRRALASALPPDTSNLSNFEVNYVLGKIKAKTVMVKDVITVTPDTAIEIAARMMADHLIGCLPVIEDGKLAGIITDRDLFFTMVLLLGARSPGLRVTVSQPDRKGEVARLTTAIAEAGGYLSVSIGYYPEDQKDQWISVYKVQQIEKEKLIEVINGLEDTTVLDIREFQEIA